MRYWEIIGEDVARPTNKLPMDDESRLARAEAMGFDTSTIWYHGTKARSFSRFRVGKDGIDELGAGIYFCSNRQYAEPWARGGRMLECFLKKGEFFDLSRLKKDKQGPGHTRDRAMAELHPRHTAMMNKLWGDGNGYDLDHFKDMIDQNSKHSLSELLHKLGYMGAVDPESQIPTQCVVFDPKDIRLTTAKFDPAKAENGTIRD